MEVLRTRDELRQALDRSPRPVGLVPTMGWLHAGHRSLIARARSETATVVVTIFVNPRQFDDPSDLDRYPRSEAHDVAICAAEGADLIWAPPVTEVYPPGFDTTVAVGAIASPLEGAARPGHFDGVATVVAVLFGLIRAERAYFGCKDFQQLRVIDRMARDLAIGTEVVGCPTVREPDGLAMSSRNVHLSAGERAAAPVLHRALVAGRDAWAAGERDADRLRRIVAEMLAAEPLAEPEYVSCADARTLVELEVVDRPALLSLAVRFGPTRLIDNELLDGSEG
ncbi:MAG: pantoate--beta-alanine ligase [Chloroflexi bacterium]|nr:pantoate--beta-alanine ligase [Chloroflexota bacterium]